MRVARLAERLPERRGDRVQLAFDEHQLIDGHLQLHNQMRRQLLPLRLDVTHQLRGTHPRRAGAVDLVHDRLDPVKAARVLTREVVAVTRDVPQRRDVNALLR